MKLLKENNAPGRKFADPTPARLTLIHSEEKTRDNDSTPTRQQALHAVYDLISEVANRVRAEGLERAA